MVRFRNGAPAQGINSNISNGPWGPFRPHLAAVAGIVHREDLWQLCRDELRSRRLYRWLGYPGPLVRQGGRSHAAAG
jgi:hypothetical protein